MIPKDSDSSSDGDWDDPEELGWTEFEWETYLRSQDGIVQRYLAFYEQTPNVADRLDQVARLMGWDDEDEDETQDFNAEQDLESSDFDDVDPYTVQRNPVFVATTALYQLLGRSWDLAIADTPSVPARLALAYQSSLFRGERQALIGIHSLDLGDFTLAISQFKRAMRELNETMRILSGDSIAGTPALASFALTTMPRLFDLREVLLRVLRECRDEVARHPRNSEGDGDDDKRAGGN